MQINLQELRNRKEYIDEIHHNRLPLILWNYNHRCQYDRAWDQYTVACRGLITDENGNIVSRPFPKFFNWDEDKDSFDSHLLSGLPSIYEKMDGSLGILYFDDGAFPCIATRGAWHSEQAEWATAWLQKHNWDNGAPLPSYTYLFEIIYPSNRIVVNYGDRAELVLLAVINTETGEEIDYIDEAKRLGISYAKPFEGTFTEVQEHLLKVGASEEGFVLKFKDGTRFKIKGEEYVRLHRLITGFSSKHIWECLSNDTPLDDVLQKVPDEFYDWAKRVEGDLKESFNQIVHLTDLAAKAVQDLPSRKEKALRLVSEYPLAAPFVFALMDGKDLKSLIWRSLKPAYETPFKETAEET